jgi:hypothetical protein
MHATVATTVQRPQQPSNGRNNHPTAATTIQRPQQPCTSRNNQATAATWVRSIAHRTRASGCQKAQRGCNCRNTVRNTATGIVHIVVKGWSNIGQMLVKYWSNADHRNRHPWIAHATRLQLGCGGGWTCTGLHWPITDQTMVELMSNTDRILQMGVQRAAERLRRNGRAADSGGAASDQHSTSV